MNISVIIPCLCEPKQLDRCLRSVVAQTYQFGHLEVIVIDDASPISLELLVTDFSRELSPNRSWIYHRNIINCGRARSRNIGLGLATGDVVIFLDVDNSPAQDCFEKWSRYFTTPTPCAVRGNIQVEPQLLEHSAYLRYFNSRYLGYRNRVDLGELDMENLPPKFYATGEMATTMSAIRSVGGFDENFTAYGCEDEDLGVRLSLAKIPLRFGQDVKLYDCDDRATLSRACKRMTTYAAHSVPLLLKKHPEYAALTTFSILELPLGRLSTRSKMIRLLLVFLLRPIIGRVICAILTAFDGSPRWLQPPAFLYQVALAAFYLMGYRSRL